MGRQSQRRRYPRTRGAFAQAVLRQELEEGTSLMRVRNVAAALALLGLALGASAEVRKFEMTIEEFDLKVAPSLATKVWAYDGQVPGPLIRVKEGDTVEVHLTNNTTMSHTIHWHGIYQTGTWQMDGVPDVSQKAIEPGESFVYKFVADKPGSIWY